MNRRRRSSSLPLVWPQPRCFVTFPCDRWCKTATGAGTVWAVSPSRPDYNYVVPTGTLYHEALGSQVTCKAVLAGLPSHRQGVWVVFGKLPKWKQRRFLPSVAA